MTTTAQKSPFAGSSRKTRLSSGRPTSKDGDAPNIWKSMLDDVASGKGLPEKQLLVLGGTPESQREFLETLNPEALSSRQYRDRRKPKTPPISNRYALGYTYHDVLDADQEDTLARLSIYMLSNPSPSLAPLLTRLFTTKTVPETLITILLDWADPWKWPHQLRQWIRLLRSILITLDDDVKVSMEENMTEWKEKRKGVDAPTGNYGQQATTDGVPAPAVTIGPGEWDEGLGIPLCVVCQNAEKIERLEKEFGWEEGEFDFVAQWLRTILLKHGASCIYTPAYDSNSVRLLIHTSLGIHSLLKRETVKHNIVDRDKMLIPPNWDSWAKIRILREGFDMETLSAAWSTEIQDSPSSTFPDPDPNEPVPDSPSSSAVSLFATTLPDPSTTSNTLDSITQSPSRRAQHPPPPSLSSAHPRELTCPDTQTFLSEQSALLDRLREEDAREEAARESQRKTNTASAPGTSTPTTTSSSSTTNPNPFDRDRQKLLTPSSIDAEGRMAEQIGPVQFNMGGIQVDADDAVRRLREKERERERDREREKMGSPARGGGGGGAGGSGVGVGVRGGSGGGGEAVNENDQLRDFFAGLLRKGGQGGQGGQGSEG